MISPCSVLSNALALSLVVGKLMGGALCLGLMNPSLRYARTQASLLIAHPEHPASSAMPPDPTAPHRPYGKVIQQHTEVHTPYWCGL